MLISLEWLSQYIDINENIMELENALTMIGQEVEAIEEQGKFLDNVVVGKIVELTKHPDSEKLTYCKVDVGDKILPIICGAKNHKNGDKVAVAKVGAILPGEFKIKKAKIRGVESEGMLCSEKELGLSESHEGIMILEENAKVGENLKEHLKENDIVFELEITPNRPDCLSHIGIARELGAYYGRKVKYPEIKIEENSEKASDYIDVDIVDSEKCKRYAACVIKDVKIGESPNWLKKRLNAIGIRSINNVVDVSNYILMEYGHPIHAFDYDKIEGKKIVVRAANENEKIVTLDNVERELDSSMLVIADTKKAVAIAGVMGGLNSEITNETKDLLIEIAYFKPENIRKTSKKLGLASDASYRYERGIDIEDTETVAKRAAQLIQSVAGGEIVQGIVDKYIEKPETKEIMLNINKLSKFLGKDIEKSRIVEILKNLELEVEDLGDDLKVIPTSFRGDLERAADLYEEVLRIYGFENIQSIMPTENIKPGKIDSNIALAMKYKKYLSEIGLQEVINYSFIPEAGLNKIYNEAETVKIKNPINEDMAILRPTLAYSFLTNIKDNLNRNISDLKIFEVSKLFFKSEEKLPIETLKFGVALSGKNNKNLWDAKPNNYDFYDLKGYVESFFEILNFKNYTLKRSESKMFHPGRSVDLYVGRDLIGSYGEIHINVLENMGIKERVYIAEFDIEKIEKYSKKKTGYKKIVKYPAIQRDLAIVAPEDVLVGDLLKVIEKGGKIVEKVELFDVYKGEQVEKGFKSIAISVTFRSETDTLKDEEVDKVLKKILGNIEKRFNGKLRS
ncbi:phenylalanine--tRNA ligase beta subunit [Haliovirga abyssi]|uniref:Phenylalanine--tRNA ligase beta subunit n=2 Tax=Haliovirga abyssi TaxID=2996794 RepID=A0AAU9DGF2_9FUSO|nr:phenylalanine--tRNA ligase subunit beta [Haliovirga abyssi]BDU51338.1 phenylalanine--tRNA ligase beta subunit [Haliovirga abyssi]